MFLHALALLGAVWAPPSAEQYYARAVDVMNALPQPAFATYDIAIHVIGAGMETECRPNEDASFGVGWGRGMESELYLAGEYALGGNQAAIRDVKGDYCRDNVAIFKPEWAAMHDWMRNGLLGEAAPAPTQKPGTAAAPDANSLHTIASEIAVAPADYRIYDMGGATCPDGSAGHALHLVAREDSDKYPLTDVIVQTQSMRFCFMRFNIVNAAVAGTGAKADTTIAFGSQNGYWAVSKAHLTLSLRMFGISLKHIAVDLAYSHMAYPATLPEPIPGKTVNQRG